MVEPTDRSPCPELGVECIYPHGTQLDPNGIQLDIVDCIQMTVSDQAWIVYQDFCRRDCSPLSDAGAFVDISGTTPCAARNVVDCTALYAGSISPYDTNQSSLDSMLISDAAKCEVVPGSYGLVFFDQGCATRMWSPAASSSTASMCVANAVANERFRCATNLGCGVVGVPRLDGAVEVGRGSEL
jgi:hypothetical protein